jgi:hypothetical protein
MTNPVTYVWKALTYLGDEAAMLGASFRDLRGDFESLRKDQAERPMLTDDLIEPPIVTPAPNKKGARK